MASSASGNLFDKVSFFVGFQFPTKTSWADGCFFFIGVIHLHIAASKARSNVDAISHGCKQIGRNEELAQISDNFA
ncbi:hypothetical protein MUK42_12261 [Musa troglodytarum]|uniref:Uncharacterized protein n=1 Tax=Musa troglodytarum TaxID=320322 RepID=A0A9E7GSC4_9LILI|nr:hypothetical protein MUK42_12261 [Musa troglodytarum]